ncbi:MAG TPA: DHH family phosphoesterase [Methanomassiliicoccales archaeon]|nr:DHH family phosphoesterase [Methanomassiliicoccales archaeon]
MLREIANELKQGRKLVLVHGNADPDALGCAYAISRCFPNVTVYPPGGIDRISKVIADKLDFALATQVLDLDEFDKIVVLDTSSPDQLSPLKDLPPNCIAIDHHARTERWGAHRYYCDDSKRSCAEIVYQMLKESGTPYGRDVGLALLAGMLTDSGHFKYANPALLCTFGEIMKAKSIEMDEVLDLTDVESEISERISQLKGAQRLRFERLGEYLIVTSHGSAFESSVCKALLAVGADVAFVGSQRGEEFRISARARGDVVRTGLHLGKMLGEVGGETSNDGGGHGGAAGIVGIGDVEAMLNICMSRTLDFLRKQRKG